VAARVAARHALNVHDYDDAVTFAVMAAETGESTEEKGEAHELRGDALRRLDRNGEAAAAYARARLVGGVSPEAGTNLRRKELRCALVAGTVSADAAATEARKLAENASALPPQKRAAVELVLAEALVAAGEVVAAAAAARGARDAAAEIGDRYQVGEALLALGAAELKAGNLNQADGAAREAGAIFGELADPSAAARAASLVGQVAAAAQDLPAARTAFDDALRQAERAHVTRLVRQIKERQAELED
jgi:tetratricopeptide (TPR) repeat protein